MKNFLLLAILFSPSAAHAACNEASSATSAKWNNKAVNLTAGNSKAKAPSIPFDTKINLALLPSAKVTLAKTGEGAAPVGFSGLAKVNPVDAGNYEVALGERVWVDVVDAGTGASVTASTFKKNGVSTGATKTISFPLEAGRLYFFQVSSAKSGSLAMLVHPAGDAK
jgi:hypothetical protein